MYLERAEGAGLRRARFEHRLRRRFFLTCVLTPLCVCLRMCAVDSGWPSIGSSVWLCLCLRIHICLGVCFLTVWIKAHSARQSFAATCAMEQWHLARSCCGSRRYELCLGCGTHLHRGRVGDANTRPPLRPRLEGGSLDYGAMVNNVALHL